MFSKQVSTIDQITINLCQLTNVLKKRVTKVFFFMVIFSISWFWSTFYFKYKYNVVGIKNQLYDSVNQKTAEC